jgi:branched-chain amino acid aminotransferase
MLNQRVVFLDDTFVDWDQATVHQMSHAFGRGSAIFEIMGLHRAVSGSVIFRLDQHIQRLYRTAALLEMEISFTRDQLTEKVKETVRRNQVRSGFIKIIGAYTDVAFSIMPPDAPLAISIFVVDPDRDLGGLSFPFETGTTVGISKWRKLDPQTVPVEAKTAANYLNGMVARNDTRRRGFENVVLLDTQGFVAEGPTESIFFVKDGTLYTPASGTVLKSITRGSIIEAARYYDVPVKEARIPRRWLWTADELFLAGTPNKVLPVRQIEDRTIDTVPGPVTQKISKIMSDITNGRNEHFSKWLFPVTPDA